MKTLLLLVALVSLDVCAFDVASYSEPVPESNPVTRVRATHLRSQFSFAVPPTWKSGTNPEVWRIWMQSENSQNAIVVQLATNSAPSDAAVFRQQIADRWPGGLILEEFSAPSGGSAGLGINVRRKINDRIWMMTRVCVFKAATRAIEISLTASPEDWESVQGVWTSFINSFRVESLPASAEHK